MIDLLNCVHYTVHYKLEIHTCIRDLNKNTEEILNLKVSVCVKITQRYADLSVTVKRACPCSILSGFGNGSIHKRDATGHTSCKTQQGTRILARGEIKTVILILLKRCVMGKSQPDAYLVSYDHFIRQPVAVYVVVVRHVRSVGAVISLQIESECDFP